MNHGLGARRERQSKAFVIKDILNTRAV